MTIRKRNDSVKRGQGIDGGEGEDFSRKYAVDPWSYPGEKSSEKSYPGAYTENESGLRARRPDDERALKSKDIFDDVNANDRPNGDFDTTGPIKYGVNK